MTTNQRFNRTDADEEDIVAQHNNTKPPPSKVDSPQKQPSLPDLMIKHTTDVSLSTQSLTIATSTQIVADSYKTISAEDGVTVHQRRLVPAASCTDNDDRIAPSKGETTKKKTIKDYIPNYLKPYIQPAVSGSNSYNDEDDDHDDEDTDFCMSTHVTSTKLVAYCMMEGFLPMAYNDFILLPKLHAMRSMIPLRKNYGNITIPTPVAPHPPPQSYDNDNKTTTSTTGNLNRLSSDLHISKNARKRSKHYYMTINTAFDTVVEHCQLQHGSGEHSSSCWLYPSLLNLYRAIHVATMQKREGFITKCITSEDDPQHQQQISIRLYSVEVWNVETNEFAAGEIGYTIGNTIYTSLTGCCVEDSAGSVQTAALGALLIYLQSFCIWDLGMDMPYKQTLGSQLLPRQEFIALLHTLRIAPELDAARTTSATASTHEVPSPTLPLLSSIQWPIQQMKDPVNCRDIIDALSTHSNNLSNLTSTPATSDMLTNTAPTRPLNKKQRKELKKKSMMEK